jgi:hypothetical protein
MVKSSKPILICSSPPIPISSSPPQSPKLANMPPIGVKRSAGQVSEPEKQKRAKLENAVVKTEEEPKIDLAAIKVEPSPAVQIDKVKTERAEEAEQAGLNDKGLPGVVFGPKAGDIIAASERLLRLS